MNARLRFTDRRARGLALGAIVIVIGRSIPARIRECA